MATYLTRLSALVCLIWQSCIWPASAGWLPGASLEPHREEFSKLYQRGYEQFQEGNLDEALASLSLAKGQNSRHLGVMRMLAETYRKLHRYPEAELELSSLILISKDPADQAALAHVYFEQGKYGSAVGVFREILTRQPDDLDAMSGLAMSLEGTNDLESAADQYREIVRRYPQSKEAIAARSRVERIEKALKAQSTNKHFSIDTVLGETGHGYWNLQKMPLSVYVDSGSDTRGYASEMRAMVQQAMEAWTAASGGEIRFTLEAPDMLKENQWRAMESKQPVWKRMLANIRDVPPDPVPCSIHVHWVNRMPEGLGLTWTDRHSTGNKIINKAHIWIATDTLADGSSLPSTLTPATARLHEGHARMVQEVILHEFGHALGLPHSNNPNDIMCSGIFGLNATDLAQTRSLSVRDAQSLREHYSDFKGQASSQTIAQLKQDSGAAGSTPQPGGETKPGAEPASATVELPPFAGEKGSDTAASAEAGAPAPPAERAPTEAGGDSKKDRHDPLRQAMFEISTRNYDLALTTLNKVLAANPNQPQARYLRGVVHVMKRQYREAGLDYQEVMRLTPNSELGRRASEGLKKINF